MTRRPAILSGRLASTLSAILLLLGAAAPASAQLGSGWMQYTPEKSVQLRGAGARYTNENGIETFRIAPGDERSEMRVQNDHRSGRWQFEGWVNIKPGINGGCVHQVFKFLMIVAYSNDGGELRQHSYQRLAATGVFGKWVRVNTIHDADAGRAEVYIDGTLRGTVSSASPGPNGWYHKYGIYNSSSTNPEVQWRDVKFFRGPGTSPPPNAPAPDGGPAAQDAGRDVQVVVADAAAPPADTASGAGGAGGAGGGGNGGAAGSSGGAGAGGSGRGGSGGGGGGSAGGAGAGSGGAPGAGGSPPGAGGAPPPDPGPAPVRPPRSGGSCNASGGDVSSGGLALMVLLGGVVALARRGRGVRRQ